MLYYAVATQARGKHCELTMEVTVKAFITVEIGEGTPEELRERAHKALQRIELQVSGLLTDCVVSVDPYPLDEDAEEIK